MLWQKWKSGEVEEWKSGRVERLRSLVVSKAKQRIFFIFIKVKLSAKPTKLFSFSAFKHLAPREAFAKFQFAGTRERA